MNEEASEKEKIDVVGKKGKTNVLKEPCEPKKDAHYFQNGRVEAQESCSNVEDSSWDANGKKNLKTKLFKQEAKCCQWIQ